MLDLTAFLSRGVSAVEAALGALKGIFFSEKSSSVVDRAKQVPFHQLGLSKSFWVDMQRERFEKLRIANLRGSLTASILERALEELLDFIGARLGSPGVLLQELFALKRSIESPGMIAVIDAVVHSVSAAMYHDSSVAYANFLADVDFLINFTDIKFINSQQGQAWLGAYRPFFNPRAFDKGVGRISLHASAMLFKLMQSDCATEQRCSHAYAQLQKLEQWRAAQLDVVAQPLVPGVLDKLRILSNQRQSGSVNPISIVANQLKVPPSPRTVVHSFAQRFTSIFRPLFDHPFLSAGVVLFSQAVVVQASRFNGGYDSSASDYLSTLDLHPLGPDKISAQDLSSVFQTEKTSELRHLSEASDCVTGPVQFPTWAQTIGGSERDISNAIAVGQDGSVVMVGETESYGAGGADVLVVKYDSTGMVLWAQALGADGWDVGSALAIKENGEIIVVGSTDSSGNGDNDVLLTILQPDGGLIRALGLGGSSDEAGNAVAVSPSGEIVVVGHSESFGLGSADALLAQFQSDGVLLSAQTLGGPSWDSWQSVAFTESGYLLLAGITESSNFGSDIILAQYGTTGELEWSQHFGGNDTEVATAVAAGAAGEILVLGSTSSTINGDFDVLMLNYTRDGQFVRASTMGGRGWDYGQSFAVGPNGQTIVVGYTNSTGAGNNDVFMVSSGNEVALDWGMVIGGTRSDHATAVTFDGTGKIVVTGSSDSFGSNGEEALTFYLADSGEMGKLASRVRRSNLDLGAFIQDLPLEQLTNRSISLTGYNVTTQLRFEQLSLNATDVSYSAISALSHIVNATAFAALPDPILTFDFDYTLPSQPFSGIVQRSKINLDVQGVNWLNYNRANQQLTGTPLDAVLGQASATLRVVSTVEGAGALSNDIPLRLCVRPRQASGAQLLGDSKVGGAFELALDELDQMVVVGQTEVGESGDIDILISRYTNENLLVWAHVFGGNGLDRSFSVALDSGGDIVLVGDTRSFGASEADALLARLTPDGEIVWVQSFGGSENDILRKALVLSDGRVCATGYTHSYGEGLWDGLVVMYSKGGVLEWAQTLGGVYRDFLYSAIESPDGKIIVVGETTEFSGATSNMLLAQYQPDGTLEWVKTVGGSNNDIAYDLFMGNSGDIILGGATESFGTTSKELFLVRYRSDWELEWGLVFGGPDVEIFSSIFNDQRDAILITGRTYSFGAGDADALMVRLQADGNFDWGITLGGENLDAFLDGHVNSGGHYMLTGFTQSFGLGDFDQLLVDVEANGRVVGVGSDILQPIPELIMRWVTPSVNNATLTPTAWLVQSINHTAAAYTQNATLVVDKLSGFFLNMLPATHPIEFNQPFTLDLGRYLLPSTSVLSITAADQSALPPWMEYDFDTSLLSGTPAGGARGRYYINLDLEQLNAQQSVTFILEVVNTAPYFIGNQTLTHPTGRFLFPLGALFRDRESDRIERFELALVHDNLPDPLAAIGTFSGHLFGSATTGDQGSYQFNVTAIDNYGGVGWVLITLNIQNSSPKPVHAFSNPAPVTIGSLPLRYEFLSNAFIDEDGDPVRYEADAPSFLHFDPTSRTLSGEPSSDDRGVFPVQISAIDPYGGVANVSITVDINASPVQIDVLESLVSSPVGQLFQAAIPPTLYYDPDGDPIHFQLVSENIRFIPPPWLNFDSAGARFYGTPDRNVHLAIPVQLEVSDGRGGRVFHTLDIETPNSAPIVVENFPNQVQSVNQVRTNLIPSSVFLDVDSDSLSYTVQLVQSQGTKPMRAGMVSIASNVLTFATQSGDQGNYALEISASDSYGGQVTTQFNLNITNQIPIVAYPIPVPPLARSGQLFTHAIDVDNFVDSDGDPLVYTAERENGQGLPSWLAFNAIRRSFTGTPSGADRGIIEVRVCVSDRFGGHAEDAISINVVNSAPVVTERVLDRQISGLDKTFTFSTPSFEDPDGDVVSYSARLRSGSPLPENWISFNPVTRVFTVYPPRAIPGNYQISIIATDVFGEHQEESFNIAVQEPPNLDQGDDARVLLQQMLPVLSAGALLSLVVLSLAWRTRRIRVANQVIVRWAKQLHLSKSFALTVDFENLFNSLKSIKARLKRGAPLAEVEALLVDFDREISQYYAQANERTMPMTWLLNIGIVNALINFVESNLLELKGDNLDMEDTIDAAKLLHYFLGFVLREHTGRNRRLTQRIKASFLLPLDNLLLTLPTRTVNDVAIYHQLQCSREALICMTGTTTVGQLCRSIISHTLSPGALVNDLKAAIFEVPSTWYVRLLKLNQNVSRAKVDIKVLKELQRDCAAERDWRFRYGVIESLLSIIIDTSNQAIRRQAIHGERRYGRVVCLGYMHLLHAKQSYLCCWRNFWVSRQAKEALNRVAHKLNETTRIMLCSYLDRKPGKSSLRTRRESMIVTPLDRREFIAHSTEVSGSTRRLTSSSSRWVSNPMGRTGLKGRAADWVPAARGRVAAKPQSVRPVAQAGTPAVEVETKHEGPGV